MLHFMEYQLLIIPSIKKSLLSIDIERKITMSQILSFQIEKFHLSV